jgi:hypothetical protein
VNLLDVALHCMRHAHAQCPRCEELGRGLALAEPLLAVDVTDRAAEKIVHNVLKRYTYAENVGLVHHTVLDGGRIGEYDQGWCSWDVDLPRFVLEPQTSVRQPVIARLVLQALEHDRDLRVEGMDLARLALRRALVLGQQCRGDRDAAECNGTWRERLGGDPRRA